MSFTTRVIQEGPGYLELEAAELRVVAGPDKGATVSVGLDTLCIGSAQEADLVLRDPTVSGRHVEVSRGSRGTLARDLSSKNGLYVGPCRVERVYLADGLRLRLGETTLLARAKGGLDRLPLVASGNRGRLVARSLAMRAMVAQLEQLAPSEATILLEGESGTGKELCAETIHRMSPRCAGPFVVFDCGATPRALIASELLGHERGAFTGSVKARPGAVAEASGGTLFLDEIGELPLELQPALLRVTDKRSVRRVGGGVVDYDVRILCATNRNLREEIKRGRFREDLFHRLCVGHLRVPPLRQRPEDIPELARQIALDVGLSLTPELESLLSAHNWPGNVRELRNTLMRISVGLRPEVAIAPLEARARGELLPLPEARRQAIAAFECEYVRDALARAGGNVTRAAKLAGVTRQIMTKLVSRHGLRARNASE